MLEPKPKRLRSLTSREKAVARRSIKRANRARRWMNTAVRASTRPE